MNRTVFSYALLTATLALPLPATAASLIRTFVSSAGNDSNPCTITQSCATFAHAYTLTQNNGIIAALDPGKYGALAINHAVTVNGNGWAAVTAPAQGSGIVVTAGSNDIVVLNGINIDGAGAAYDGIAVVSGAQLTVSNCVIGNFSLDSNNPVGSGNGILLLPVDSGTYTFTIRDTTITNSPTAGLSYYPGGTPTATFVIDHVFASKNVNAISLFTGQASGAVTRAAITNSIVSSNYDGISLNGNATTFTVAVDNALISNNTDHGIEASAPVNVLLGRSVITGINYGVFNSTGPNTFYSYGDNRVDGNTTADVVGSNMAALPTK